ncbi:MAG: FIST C-terminal domain-containing protein [Rubrivivax sp.]|nr:FIST C-terminal domain-containing protein [Rubrivivax sp.]
MSPYVVGHATHPEWTGAFALVAAQLDAQAAPRAHEGGAAGPCAAAPTLGLVYFTDAYAPAADALLAALRQRWPGVSFVGTVGVGVCAGGVEYFDEPALVVMLMTLPREQFQVFSGTRGLRGAGGPGDVAGTVAGPAGTLRPAAALVHADPATPDLPELLAELAGRTEAGYLFGGVSASRKRHVQLADAVLQGGLSGVAFGEGVPLVSRVTQGCAPLGPARRITASDGTVVLALDGQPALPQLLADLHLVRKGSGENVHPRALRDAVPRLRRTLVGLSPPRQGEGPAARPGSFGDEVRVRHLIGIDPGRQGIAVAEQVHPGMRLSFCQRDAAAARRDLVRMCTEVRDEIESRAEALHPAARTAAGAGAAGGGITPPGDSRGALGAVYVSCSGRGGAHFGAPSAELQIVRHALGDVPLVGFFAAGEIARRQLYGYTGVLTVFCEP